MPGSTSPSIHPILKVNTNGSLRKIFVPPTGAEGVVFGTEYAVAAMRCDVLSFVPKTSGDV
jgi:hypothetical protein